jgi:pyruvate,orthophosphate dikinase
MNAKFGSKGEAFPLLLSVRSGARVSMPGMMNTVLNLGMNDDAVKVLAEKSGNERFAWDSYRRFIQMYGDVVMGVEAEKGHHDPFEVVMDKVKEARGYKLDTISHQKI